MNSASRRTSASFLEGVRTRGVLLLMPSAKASLDDSAYWSWCLAAGFQEIGVPVFSNESSSFASRGITVAAAPEVIHDDTMVIGDISAIESCNSECVTLARRVFERARRSALLCMSDVVSSVDFPDTAPVFVAHSNSRIFARGHRIPWAFGLSREVIDKIAGAHRPQVRERLFLRNFRPSGNQSVRNALDLSFVKRLADKVAIDTSFDNHGRWNSHYFDRLGGSLGCLAYGGHFVEDFFRREEFRSQIGERRILSDEPAIDRWDSWRFWESLASGCVTVALDFDEYGLQIPVKPVNGVHYVGLRLDRLEDAVALLSGPQTPLAVIAENGREWVTTHYAPAPVAHLFLETMERLEESQ